MVKKFILLAMTACFLNTSGICMAQSEKNEPEIELSATSIVLKGSTLYVNNAGGSVLEIFSLTGTKITAVRIDSNEKTIELSLKKGCYILRIDKLVRKITIR